MIDSHDSRTGDVLTGGWRVGYARVSTDDQNLDLQRDALGRTGCSQVYEEMASGKDAARPQLDACLKAIRPGDTLVVWRLDRLGRSLPDLVRIVTELEARGVGFESLTEKIDTSSATGKLTFHLFAALAEFERNLIRERTAAGLAAARARGRNGGRPQKLTDDEKRMVALLMKGRETKPGDVCEQFGISRALLYKTVKEQRAIEEVKQHD